MNWIDFFFQTDGGHFQWVGISAFVAAGGLFVNSRQNRKKFKADLVSQSRIKWIDTARSNMGEYLSVTTDTYPKALNSASSYTKWKTEEGSGKASEETVKLQYIEDTNAYNEVITEKNKQYDTLLLLFNPTSENADILKAIEKCNKAQLNMVRTIQKKADDAVKNKRLLTGKDIAADLDVRKTIMGFSEALEQLRDESRFRFQKEWEKSKKGN